MAPLQAEVVHRCLALPFGEEVIDQRLQAGVVRVYVCMRYVHAYRHMYLFLYLCIYPHTHTHTHTHNIHIYLQAGVVCVQGVGGHACDAVLAEVEVVAGDQQYGVAAVRLVSPQRQKGPVPPG